MNVLLSFAAALVSLRLAGLLLRSRHYAWAGGRSRSPVRPRRWPGAPPTAGTRESFRACYLAGALLSAPLLGIGSLDLWPAPLGGAARPHLHGPRGRRRRWRCRCTAHSPRPACRTRRITSTRSRGSSRSSASILGTVAVVTSRRRRCGAARSATPLPRRGRRAPRPAASALDPDAVRRRRGLLRAVARRCSSTHEREPQP